MTREQIEYRLIRAQKNYLQQRSRKHIKGFVKIDPEYWKAKVLFYRMLLASMDKK